MPHHLEAIISQLRASHDGDPWYGSPRMRFLEDLTPEQAASHPVAGGHSVWELVLHLTGWTNEVRRRMAGGRPGEPEGGDWPPVAEPSAGAWRKAMKDLAAAHAALVTSAESLGEADAARDVGNGTTVATMLVGLAQHDAYHAGQLALLRRALETSPAAR